jgi:hypothetical protein
VDNRGKPEQEANLTPKVSFAAIWLIVASPIAGAYVGGLLDASAGGPHSRDGAVLGTVVGLLLGPCCFGWICEDARDNERADAEKMRHRLAELYPSSPEAAALRQAASLQATSEDLNENGGSGTLASIRQRADEILQAQVHPSEG